MRTPGAGRVRERFLPLMVIAVCALCGCGKPNTASSQPDMYSQMRGYGFVWTDARAPAEADGRPRVYRVSQIGKPGVPQLDDVMIAQIHDVSAQIKSRYRVFLSFTLIDEFPQYRYLVVFLANHPRYPALNLCYAIPGCDHHCPRYFDSVVRIVHVTTMPACADALDIWSARRRPRA